MKNKEYNGFKNYSFWNISLWINNDSELYYLAIESINKYKNVKTAADYFLNNLSFDNTPDNVLWTKSGIYNALINLKKESI